MKTLLLVSALLASFSPFLGRFTQGPVSKTFKAAFYEEDSTVSNTTVVQNYYRISCPNNPNAYGCGSSGSIPCIAEKPCPVISPLKKIPCPGVGNGEFCGQADSGEVCPNPTSCPNQLTLHDCPLYPGETMCASGGSGVVCSTPNSCPPPPVAPSAARE